MWVCLSKIFEIVVISAIWIEIKLFLILIERCLRSLILRLDSSIWGIKVILLLLLLLVLLLLLLFYNLLFASFHFFHLEIFHSFLGHWGYHCWGKLRVALDSSFCTLISILDTLEFIWTSNLNIALCIMHLVLSMFLQNNLLMFHNRWLLTLDSRFFNYFI